MDGRELRALEYQDGCLRLLDQRRLPGEIRWIEARAYETVAEAIRTLAIRGAPAIGLAAAYGVVLAARRLQPGLASSDRQALLFRAIDALGATRPTAVNLFWALDRMRTLVGQHAALAAHELEELLQGEADRMMLQDEAANRAMADLGAALIPDGSNVLTHCNTGFLVSSRLGTALGAIRRAHEAGKQVHVWVDETRPLLQGARLTAWELQQLDIPFTLITDGMAAHFMARGEVDLAMVGADRIAANGDTANKIGTYGVAVLCRAHALPFYVVAPTSTVDLSRADGSAITIEDRSAEEVTSIAGVRVAPEGVAVANPAFDVTPAELVTAIVTEGGTARPPFSHDLAQHVEGARSGLVA
jgi:methylthioribose-1-phosphate isomerase